LNCRTSSATLGAQARAQEWLTHQHKYFAVLAYARANRLNRVVGTAPRARIGIVATGKSYLDVCEALKLLGVDDSGGADAVIRLFKVAMPWPLEPEGVHEFAQGLDEIVVVEEKRPIVEPQIRTMLYDWPEALRPAIHGKTNEYGTIGDCDPESVLSSVGDFSVIRIARVIAGRLERLFGTQAFRSRLQAFEQSLDVVQRARSIPARSAYYCSGCPHSTSTRVPPGSVALAGIGCHVMATSIYPEHNRTFTQMGGEGATWIGQAPFSNRPHVFANLGDGTYFHSGGRGRHPHHVQDPVQRCRRDDRRSVRRRDDHGACHGAPAGRGRRAEDRRGDGRRRALREQGRTCRSRDDPSARCV
jgi:indolepyruvate ferredoxin oxidoreductase